jgi:hypothetical protein
MRKQLKDLEIGEEFSIFPDGARYQRCIPPCESDFIYVTGGNVMYLTFSPDKLVYPVKP